MSFSVHFTTRDHNPAHQMSDFKITPLACSWTAFGGPDQASFKIEGPPEKLLLLVAMLRFGVTITDQNFDPVWWGFVHSIHVNLSGSQIDLSLDQLFNKVKVFYSFMSPDNKVSDQYETDFAHDLTSQAEFGIKERAFQILNIDDIQADALRDTYLKNYAWPKSGLITRSKSGQNYVIFRCKGWFHTLTWRYYQNLDGFYANYGPGPGAFRYGRPNYRLPAQKFTPSAAGSVKYAYFMLRKYGNPVGPLYCRLYDDNGNKPAATYTTSEAVTPATALTSTGYTWVRFTFTNPVSLSASTPYWVSAYCATSDSANCPSIRIDENANYKQDGHYAKYSDVGTWKTIPNTTGDTYPHLYFRVVCITDTGQQLYDIAAAMGQFFARIAPLTTGVESSPYRDNGRDGQREILDLMKVGTSSGRLVLADVTPERHLQFYEQPDPKSPTAFVAASGRFYSQQGKPLMPYQPPVGQFVYFSGSSRLLLPFDQNRVPACFVSQAKFNFRTGVASLK